MQYEISVPNKTFVLGEYIVLKGGPALILTTAPRFTLIATSNNHAKRDVMGIHPDSPAGKLIATFPDFYRQFNLQFIDPYHQQGGFGASSAQFLMVYALKEAGKQEVDGDKKITFNEIDLLAQYQALANNDYPLPPSGGDVIAQLYGGLCFFHRQRNLIQSYQWPFTDLAYGLIHTGKKIATHTHLQTLGDFDSEEMQKIVLQGLNSLKNKDEKNFIQAVQLYSMKMQVEGLLAEHAQELLNIITTFPKILAAKGCGSLGADVIFFCYHQAESDAVIAFIKEQRFNLITHGSEVENGLTLHCVNPLT